jgi:hypothetical protein
MHNDAAADLGASYAHFFQSESHQHRVEVVAARAAQLKHADAIYLGHSLDLSTTDSAEIYF